MSWNTIQNQIKTVLEGVSELQFVAGYPTLGFPGFPAAYVVPSDQEGDYETQTENVRIYAFIVRIFYDTKQVGSEEALESLRSVVDKVLDALDQEDQKNEDSRTIGKNLPDNYTFLNIFAHPSVWGEIPERNLLMAEIRVRIRISVDVS